MTTEFHNIQSFELLFELQIELQINVLPDWNVNEVEKFGVDETLHRKPQRLSTHPAWTWEEQWDSLERHFGYGSRE